MLIYVNTKSLFNHLTFEPLFLNPDGARTRFPIGWGGGGRYVQGSLKIYKNGIPLNKNSYTEESNGVFFNFNTAPEEGLYTDYTVQFNYRQADYAFSTGSADSAYPGEEYFLFPNWNNAKGCGDAFWVGKYAASHADATSSAQGTSTIPVSKKGKPSWVNTRWDTQVNSCLTKGNGFHCIRNREWISIALWTEKMGINVKGNYLGYPNSGTNIDGDGTNITSSMADTTDSNYKILTGTGPATFRHNGRIDGISDMVGNVYECVDGFQLRNGIPYILDENNTNYVALNSSDITSWQSTSESKIYYYINNSTNDLLNEGLPVETAGMPVSGNSTLWKNNSGTRFCYRGDNVYSNNDKTGIWTLKVNDESFNLYWNFGFRLACTLHT